MNDIELKDYIKSRLERMKSIRMRGEDRRLSCCSMMNHRLDDHNSPVTRRKLNSVVAIDALQTTQRGMAGYMLSPSIRWFRYVTKGRDFQPSDDIRGANDWLQLVEDLQYQVFSNSRFYSTSLMALGDVLIYGTSYEMVSDEVSEGRVVYDCYNPFECYIDEDGQRRVDTFFREYKMTADEALAKWGDECPQGVVDLVARKAGSTECTFIHAIFPRERAEVADVPVPAAVSKPFASVHWCSVDDAVFKVSGYDEFPLAVHRYRLADGTPYGTSLVNDHLELIIESDYMHGKYDKSLAKQVDPPTFVPQNLKGRYTQNPGDMIYGDPQQGAPVPLQTSLDLKGLAEHMLEVDALINRVLFADLFNVLMRQDRQRTAYEVQELKGEGLILLSAVIGNMQEEKLNPLVLRTFGILLRNGLVPPPPEELRKAWKTTRIRIELEGPLAQTMKQYHQTTGFMQGLQWISAVGQLFPESMVNIDGDELMRGGSTAQGLPQTTIREKADVDRIKRQQAQNQARAQQQQDALVQSQVAKNMGVDAQAMAQAQAASGSEAQQMIQNGATIGG